MLLLSLLPLVTTQLPPPAQSFPAFDVAWERVLVGAPPVVGAVGEDAGAPSARGRFTTDGGVVRMLEILEDEEDTREGLKALKDERGTLGWETFKREHLDL